MPSAFIKPAVPKFLLWEEVKVGKPGPGEARIRHTAVGLNFVDIYNRSGLYPAAAAERARRRGAPAWSRKSAPASPT